MQAEEAYNARHVFISNTSEPISRAYANACSVFSGCNPIMHISAAAPSPQSERLQLHT